MQNRFYIIETGDYGQDLFVSVPFSSVWEMIVSYLYIPDYCVNYNKVDFTKQDVENPLWIPKSENQYKVLLSMYAFVLYEETYKHSKKDYPEWVDDHISPNRYLRLTEGHNGESEVTEVFLMNENGIMESYPFSPSKPYCKEWEEFFSTITEWVKKYVKYRVTSFNEEIILIPDGIKYDYYKMSGTSNAWNKYSELTDKFRNLWVMVKYREYLELPVDPEDAVAYKAVVDQILEFCSKNNLKHEL